jgi:hypothetical protein
MPNALKPNSVAIDLLQADRRKEKQMCNAKGRIFQRSITNVTKPTFS